MLVKEKGIVICFFKYFVVFFNKLVLHSFEVMVSPCASLIMQNAAHGATDDDQGPKGLGFQMVWTCHDGARLIYIAWLKWLRGIRRLTDRYGPGSLEMH